MKGSANAVWITLSGYAAPVRRRSTVTGPKIAAVERREARVPGNNGTRHLHEVPVCYRSADRRSAPSRMRGGKKKEAPPRASLTIGVDGARLYAGDASSRCLTCESETVRARTLRRDRAPFTAAPSRPVSFRDHAARLAAELEIHRVADREFLAAVALGQPDVVPDPAAA